MSLSTSASIERQKRQVLRTLNLDSRPPRLRQTPQIPYSLRSTNKEHDFNDGVLETMLVEPRSQSWSCVTPEAIVSDCFEYSLKSVNHQIISASFSISSPSTNFSVIVYEVDDLFGEVRYVDRFEVKEYLENHRFDMSKMFQEWMKTRYQMKMIKIEILNSHSTDILELHDYLSSPPHFEITVFQPNTVTLQDCDGCCLLPFYTNFTEIGWADWILSPPGFWSNHCAGSCEKFSDDTWNFLRSLKIPNMPEPGCAPNYFGSVDMVVALSSRDIRKTRVHGLRALSCSCA
ncbi:unnamed protein product [Caenorhabditis brenneri]